MSEHPCTTCPIMVESGACYELCEPLSNALFAALSEVGKLKKEITKLNMLRGVKGR